MINFKNITNRAANLTEGCGFLSARQVDAWLSGRIAPRRRRAFEGHQLSGCSSCALLAADVSVFGGVMDGGVIETERREFELTAPLVKAQLRQALARMDEVSVRKTAFGFSWNWNVVTSLAGAALLALVLIVGFTTGEPPHIFDIPGGSAIAVQPLEYSGVVTRGVGDQAWQAYADGNYAEAARLLAQVEQQDPANHDAILHQGISLLMIGEGQQAVEVLERSLALAEQGGSRGILDNWYLGQAALGTGDIELATEKLRVVREAEGVFAGYATQAADLLSRIDAR